MEIIYVINRAVENIIDLFEQEENYNRLIFRIIKFWRQSIGVNDIIFWVLEVVKMSKFCDNASNTEKIISNLINKGFDIEQSISTLVKKRAIYRLKDDNFVVSTKYRGL